MLLYFMFCDVHLFSWCAFFVLFFVSTHFPTLCFTFINTLWYVTLRHFSPPLRSLANHFVHFWMLFPVFCFPVFWLVFDIACMCIDACIKLWLRYWISLSKAHSEFFFLTSGSSQFSAIGHIYFADFTLQSLKKKWKESPGSMNMLPFRN